MCSPMCCSTLCSPMVTREELEYHLHYLANEVPTLKEYLDVLEIVFHIHRIIQTNPMEDFYRAIRIENREFSALWKYDSLRFFFYNVGWRQADDVLFLASNTNIKTALNLLLDVRFVYPLKDDELGLTGEDGRRPLHEVFVWD